MMFFKYLLTGISSVGIAGASGYTVYYFTSPDPKDRLMKYFLEEEFPKGEFYPDGEKAPKPWVEEIDQENKLSESSEEDQPEVNKDIKDADELENVQAKNSKSSDHQADNN